MRRCDDDNEKENDTRKYEQYLPNMRRLNQFGESVATKCALNGYCLRCPMTEESYSRKVINERSELKVLFDDGRETMQ